MFAQVENKSKPNVYENMTASTKRAESVFWFSLQGFLREPVKGPEAEFPIPQTCRPQKQQSEQTETRRPFVFHERNITARGKSPQKGCGTKFQCPT